MIAQRLAHPFALGIVGTGSIGWMLALAAGIGVLSAIGGFGLARRCEADRSVRAVVLTGAGKSFCFGGDLRGMLVESGDKSQDDAAAQLLQGRIDDLQKTLKLPKLEAEDIAQSVNRPLTSAYQLLAFFTVPNRAVEQVQDAILVRLAASRGLR